MYVMIWVAKFSFVPVRGRPSFVIVGSSISCLSHAQTLRNCIEIVNGLFMKVVWVAITFLFL